MSKASSQSCNLLKLRLSRRDLVAAAAVVALTSKMASAAQWPGGPVRVIVPFPAGGGTDLIARTLADRLSGQLQHPFVVENRPGAGGAVAAEYVAGSAPDGQVLFVAATPQIAILPVIQTIQYDPVRDLAPIANIATSGFVLAARSSLPVASVSDVVSLARSQPGKLTYASGSYGSLTHISMALFARRAGIDMVHVPFPGGGPAMTALRGGHVDLYFANASEALAQLDSSEIRILAVSTADRLPQLPDIPTVAEYDENFAVVVWTGLFAPAGISTQLVELLADQVSHAVSSDDVVARFGQFGILPSGASTEAFRELVEADIEFYRRVLPENDIRAE